MDNIEFEITGRSQAMEYTFKPTTTVLRVGLSIISISVMLIFYLVYIYSSGSVYPSPIVLFVCGGVVLFWLLNIKQPGAIPNPWNENSYSNKITKKMKLSIKPNRLERTVNSNANEDIMFEDLKICRARGCYFFVGSSYTFVLPFNIRDASNFVESLKIKSGLGFFE